MIRFWRWTRWRDLGWEVHGKELIIFVVRDLTDSLLCVFSSSNNSCLCLSVDRYQVMMVFPSLFLIVYRVLSRIYHLGEKSWVAKGDRPPRGVRPNPPPPDKNWCILRHNFEKCYCVCTNLELVTSWWFFGYSYLYTVMITIFLGGKLGILGGKLLPLKYPR